MSYFDHENETPVIAMLPPAPQPQNIETSAQVDKIAEAMAKANLTIENPAKDAANPHFKSNYADLAAGLKAIRKPLAEVGVVPLQVTRMKADGTFVLYTRFVHSSGQWIETEWPLGKAAGQTPQQMGSNLTYGRRYSLFGLAGIAGEDDDDDGHAASQTAQRPGARPGPPPRETTRKAKADKPLAASMSPEESAAKLDEFRKSLSALPAEAAQIDAWGKEHRAELTRLLPPDLEAITAEFRSRKNAAPKPEKAAA